MSAAERLPLPESLRKPPTERPSLRLISASDIHRGLERSSVRMDRLQQFFTEAPANDVENTNAEVIELRVEDLIAAQEGQTEVAEEMEAHSEELRRKYETEQERSHELADRYTEARTKLMNAQSELETLNTERSIIGVRRFFDAQAKVKYIDLETSLQRFLQQLGEANRELRELSPLMQANNQRLEQLEQQKTQIESMIESQKRELVDGTTKRTRDGASERRTAELRNALKTHLAASEALFTEIQQAEQANAALSQKLAELFQEQYALDQQRKALADAEEASFFRRIMPWGRSNIEQQRADLERRAKHVQREMAQTLQQVGRENAKLDKRYKQKDILDQEFFRLNQELNATE